MLVYYGNIQCISARELIDGGYITESCYRNWVNRGRIKVVRRGGGAAGNCALVALNSLPTECLERVKEDNPGGTEQALRHWILSNYVLDQFSAIILYMCSLFPIAPSSFLTYRIISEIIMGFRKL